MHILQVKKPAKFQHTSFQHYSTWLSTVRLSLLGRVSCPLKLLWFASQISRLKIIFISKIYFLLFSDNLYWCYNWMPCGFLDSKKKKSKNIEWLIHHCPETLIFHFHLHFGRFDLNIYLPFFLLTHAETKNDENISKYMEMKYLITTNTSLFLDHTW